MTYYDSGLTPGHTDCIGYGNTVYYTTNTPPMYLGNGDDESYLDSKLQFDWSKDVWDLFSTGLIKYGL